MATRLITGIIDPHIGYALAINTSQATTVSWTIYYIISLFNQLFFIIGFIKWKEMNAGKKFLFTLFVLIELFYWMGQGTNFGTISMISTLAFVSMYKLKSFKLNPKRALRFYLIIILLFAGSIYTFSYTMVNRSGSSTLNLKAFDLGLSKVETNAPIFHFLPDKLQSTYMYMVSYLAQGYYHTCLAFDLDFKPTYFLGNNPALIDFARQMNLDVWQDTYVYRLREKGVDPLINWHSAYLWYASDVSLPGVPILLFFIGYLFGFSWGVSVRINDFLSKIVFVILANMLLYLFANNSYLSSIFYSFMLILPLWFITRVKHIKL